MKWIKSRYTYINEEITQVFSKELLDIIIKIYLRHNNKIASFLSKIDNENIDSIETSYYDTTEMPDKVSYLTDRKIKDLESKDDMSSKWTKLRTITSIGRLIKKLNKDFTAKEIEEFVNLYKFYKSGTKALEIVSGEEIKKWYYEGNYVSGGGELNNSCMRYKKCQTYFDIYTENPDQVQLLILKDPNGMLLGRALIWNLSAPEGGKYLDRVYTRYETDIYVFIEWAKENGYTSYNQLKKVGIPIPDMNVELENFNHEDYKEYPYMDTFDYYCYSEGMLSSEYDSTHDYIRLISTSGKWEDYEDPSQIYCDYNGEDMHEDDVTYCSFNNGYAPHNNVIYLNDIDEYAYDTSLENGTVVYCELRNEYYDADNATYNSIMEDYYLFKNSKEVIIDEMPLKESPETTYFDILLENKEYFKIGSVYYYKTLVEKVEIEGKEF